MMEARRDAILSRLNEPTEKSKSPYLEIENARVESFKRRQGRAYPCTDAGV